jgi:peptidoglycan/LPS O-acetylase OafA/YrhL
VLVALAGAFLLHLALFGDRRDLVGGWSLDATGLHIGFARLLYPFLAGMLLMRIGPRIRSRHAFAISSLLLVAALSLPRMGATPHDWRNGLYDAACVILLFPLIVAIGAGEKRVDGLTVRIARFFGDLSFPLYITHYPLVYIYTAWVVDHHIPPQRGAIWGVLMVATAVAIAYASLKLYDEPVRRWLSARFLKRSGGGVLPGGGR